MVEHSTWFSITRLWGEHPWVTSILIFLPLYLTWIFFLRFIVLPLAPLRVLAWNEALAKPDSSTDVEVAVVGSKVKLPLKNLFKNLSLLGSFHSHPIVLRAWVEMHIDSALEAFQNLPTVESRRTFVALPVFLNGKARSSLTPTDLQNICLRDRWCLFIKGEGGLGKTTLACRLAFWASARDPAERICRDRRMLPILLEPEVGFDVRSDVKTFNRELQGRLQQFLALKYPISENLFERLLRDRRILVILDGLSEMSLKPSPDAARLENPNFPVNALIVTSRDDSIRRDLTIEPQRIDSNHLLSFINSYLVEAGQTQLTDAELFDASRRLANLVSMETGITPLLARLFAEQSVFLQKQNAPLQWLPRTVPDLMLAYLNDVNRNGNETDADDPRQ